MKKRPRVYIYNGQSGFGCFGCLFFLILMSFMWVFFTSLFIQIFPILLTVGSTIVIIRTGYQLWQWRKQDKAANQGNFIEEDGLIIPVDEPEDNQLDYLKRRLAIAILALLIGLTLLNYL